MQAMSLWLWSVLYLIYGLLLVLSSSFNVCWHLFCVVCNTFFELTLLALLSFFTIFTSQQILCFYIKITQCLPIKPYLIFETHIPTKHFSFSFMFFPQNIWTRLNSTIFLSFLWFKNTSNSFLPLKDVIHIPEILRNEQFFSKTAF